jgi:hypothetical protein
LASILLFILDFNQTKMMHKLIFSLILLLLLAPALLQYTQPIDWKPLSGDLPKIQGKELNLETWTSGAFQNGFDQDLRTQMGGREILTRIYNQWDYSLFGKINAKNVVMGKEGYLFEENYLKAFRGEDFIGKDKIESQVQKIKFLQDTLAQLNKTLIIVFAAGKGSYFPEYFPDRGPALVNPSTNYGTYRKLLLENNINFIDFNHWFVQLKDSLSYPLFSKTGIHWSSYAELLVADSLLSYMENTRNIVLPSLQMLSIDWHHPPIHRDRDIEEGMNLLFPLDNDSMAYPQIAYHARSPVDSIRGLIVSDSYYWGLHNINFTKKAFKEGHFWYYNNTVYPPYQGKHKVADIPIDQAFDTKDVILVMATEATLPNFAWGFFYNLYEWFQGGKTSVPVVSKEAIENKIKEMRADPTWLNHIREKALQKGISLDSMLYLDALYVLNRK